MNFKKVTALALSGVLAVSTLVGCGIDKSATVAVLGDQKVTLGVANFLARYKQAEYSSYISYMGQYYQSDDPWHTDLTNSGTTTEESLKASVMETLHEAYTLKNHMDDYKVSLSDEQKDKITKAAQKFMDDNGSDSLKEMGATKDIVEEVLTLYTIHDLMYNAIVADVDINVSDEDANMRGYSMITVSLSGTTDGSGNQVEYTEDEKNQLILKAKEFALLSAGKTGEEYTNLAKEYGYTATDMTYDKANTTIETTVKETLDQMKEGDNAQVVTTDSLLYIVKVTAETDEEATKNNRETIIQNRKDEKYSGVLKEWQTDDGWEIKESVWKKVAFKNYFTVEETTEAGTESSK